MKKSTLVRSDKRHAVKMAEGTNVAQRKNPKKTSAPDTPIQIARNIQKLPPVEAAQPSRLAVPVTSAKALRTKARTKTPPAEPVRAKPKAPAKPRASAKAQPETPTEPIWEQDNPIKRRIEELKTRNAQLAEQIQRLSPTARGPQP